VEGRPWYERLMKDGIVVGSQRDRSRMDEVQALQKALEKQAILRRAAVTPPPTILLKLEGPRPR